MVIKSEIKSSFKILRELLMMEFISGCLICGKELIYLEKPEKLSCFYCQKACDTSSRCIRGHFVCDACHRLSADDLIEEYCMNTDLKDPLTIAVVLMRNPAIKMHGPEHHFLVPAVLLAGYYNVKKEPKEKSDRIAKARQRAEMVKGGFCGFLGDCGAAVGTGIFVSVLTGATPLSKDEWRLSNLMTSQSLRKIALAGGPRCCKRNTYLALLSATSFIKKYFGVAIPIRRPIVCEFSSLNKECKKSECTFYRKEK